jgi:hypothetical protein
MNIFQINELLQIDADAGSFLFGLLIAALFFFKYKELEAEADEREMLENFLDSGIGNRES